MFLSFSFVGNEIYPSLCTDERRENIAVNFLDAFRIVVLLLFKYINIF
jgi:hypothetical protein